MYKIFFTTHISLHYTILDPQHDLVRQREVVLTHLYQHSHTYSAIPLAMNICDRYSGTITTDAMDAAIYLAHSVLFPDFSLPAPSDSLWRAVRAVANALEFMLYSDTCEWILKWSHDITAINWSLMWHALLSSPYIAQQVDYYLRWVCCRLFAVCMGVVAAFLNHHLCFACRFASPQAVEVSS